MTVQELLDSLHANSPTTTSVLDMVAMAFYAAVTLTADEEAADVTSVSDGRRRVYYPPL